MLDVISHHKKKATERASLRVLLHRGSGTLKKTLASSGINAGDSAEADMGGDPTAEVAPEKESSSISKMITTAGRIVVP